MLPSTPDPSAFLSPTPAYLRKVAASISLASRSKIVELWRTQSPPKELLELVVVPLQAIITKSLTEVSELTQLPKDAITVLSLVADTGLLPAAALYNAVVNSS